MALASKRTVVLDAMGVMFRAQDDVEELLVPFIAQHGGMTDPALIKAAYIDASVGALDADAFWRAARIDPALEDVYLARHELMPGLTGFIDAVEASGLALWCLSNDIGRWSAKLRRLHDLEHRFAGVVISGEVGARKPDPAIYRVLLQRVGRAAHEVWFVDDRDANVSAAREMGIDARKFCGFDALLTDLLEGK